MADFIPSGPLGAFYMGSMLAPVRTPDGKLVQSQVYGQPASVDELYRNILPPAPTPVSEADPVGPGPDPFGGYWGLQDMIAQLSPPPQPVRTASSIPGPRAPVEPPSRFERLPDLPPMAYVPGKGVPAPVQAIDNALTPPLPIPRPTPPAPKAASMSGDYVVKRGDTLWDISRKTGIPVATIASQSGVADPSRIYVGQRLNLSPRAPTPMPMPSFRLGNALAWQPATPAGRASGADPWAGLRVAPVAATPGLVTALPRTNVASGGGNGGGTHWDARSGSWVGGGQ